MLNIAGRTVELFSAAHPGAPLVVLNTVTGEGAAVYEAVRAETDDDYTMAAIGNLCWNDDLTPWPIPPIAPGVAPFTGGADVYLELLTRRILPEIIAELSNPPRYIALAGYSLGGLFALYALHRTDVFARVASASGSLWYPGFIDYVRTHQMRRQPERLYLSLGDREGHTRNPVMRPVAENTRLLSNWYRDADIETILEMNPGGHFKDSTRRMALGIAWLLKG